ncbi:unnamed protein product [Staurois parvus]|uniref:Uncharacterized protein n=1 Tax=Staurois parvus TaxID=386267 RepID=A0ABN9FAI3_9NEOB|nr:unnamed protein product [Staurois parvus]
MYINGWTGAVPKWVTVYKQPPHLLPVSAPCERTAPQSSAHCILRTQRNTNHCTGPLCEVPIM